MKNNNYQGIIIGIIFLFFAVAFFATKQYLFSFLSLLPLLIVLRIDDLKKLIINPNSGLEAEFEIPYKKIKQDIEENYEKPNKKTFESFKQVEEEVIKHIQKKIGGEMKRTIHYVYGMPNKPEFVYTPDGTIQTEKELIFIEVKYILKPEYAKRIINNALQYLAIVLGKFGPSAGKKLVIKLIVASRNELDLSSINTPQGIDLEFFKL